MKAPAIRVGTTWLALRESADAAARARDLAVSLAGELPARGRWVIHDLAGGTGGMGRWLAPLLPGPQHWVVHDLDADLLEVAIAQPPGPAADGATVSLEASHSDVTCLEPDDLAGANLITASALLDLLTQEELDRLLGVCAVSGSPMLLTLSVTGRVELAPADPLDHPVATAFNAHQRRVTERGRLLGPDAVTMAVELCRQAGADVLVRPSPWHLDAARTDLAAEWLTGWLTAACEQDAELAPEAEAYARRRLAQAAAGALTVTVEHADVLVSPSGQSVWNRGESA